MPEPLRLAAVDLGAESGRVVTGELHGDGRLTLEVAHRFANRPVWLPDGLHWNLPGLFDEILHGLAVAAQAGPLDSIGIDAWGCDYGLLDDRGALLGLPFHYRDARTSRSVMDAVHAAVGRDELYARTGIQTMALNTVFQLAAEHGSTALRNARRIVLIPDLIAQWLTGTVANELTTASTTGLLDARTGGWATDLVERLELPPAPFAGELVAPGTDLGPVLAGHADAAGAAVGVTVRAVAGHDTASAFAAAPLQGETGAVLSSGTWSLLGVELPAPRLGTDAAAANLTNERGIDGTTRLLRNVMGLWLVQECRRAWARDGGPSEYGALVALAQAARPDVPLFDPDDDSLLRGGDMPARIAALCTAAGQAAPRDPGEVVRSILTSLACRYAVVLEHLERVSEHRVDVIHVVGGGARNELLCRLTADVCARTVLAGPAEATALGNVLVQARAAGALGDPGELRRVAHRCAAPRVYEPADSQLAAETRERFAALTGPAAALQTSAESV